MEDLLLELAELVFDALGVGLEPLAQVAFVYVLGNARDLGDDRVVVPIVEVLNVLLLDVFDTDHEFVAFGVILEKAKNAV